MKNSLRPLGPTECKKFNKNWSNRFGGAWLQTLTDDLKNLKY